MNRSVLKSDRLVSAKIPSHAPEPLSSTVHIAGFCAEAAWPQIVVMAALVLAGKIQEPQRLAKQIIDTTWKLRYAHSPEEADLIHKQVLATGTWPETLFGSSSQNPACTLLFVKASAEHSTETPAWCGA